MNTKNGALPSLYRRIIAGHPLNTPAKSSLFFTATNLIAKGASFVFTPIFTRLLSAAEYGQYSLFSSYLSITLVLVTLEMPGGIMMRLLQKRKEISSFSTLSAILISLPLAIPVTLFLWLLNGLKFSGAYVFLFVSLSSLSVINLYLSKARFSYNWKPSFLMAIIQSILAPIISISVIALNYLPNSNHVSLKIGIGTLVIAVAALIMLVILMRQTVREINEKSLNATLRDAFMENAKFLIKLSLSLLPYYFVVMAISQSDKILISRYHGDAALGKYSVAYSVGIALTAITSGIMSALCPWIMRKIRAGDIYEAKTMLNRLVSLGVPLITCFLCLAPDVFRILFPPEYYSALPVLFFAAQIPIPLAISSALSSIAIAKEKVLGVFLFSLIPFSTVVLLDLILIPSGPIFIASAITALGYIILFTSESFNAKRILGKFPINVNHCFQKMLLLSVFSSIAYALRNNTIARILLAVVSLVLLLYMLASSFSLLSEKKECSC